MESEEFEQALAVAHKNDKKLHFEPPKTRHGYPTGYATDFDHNHL
jgi:hypothetical protein